MLDSRAVIDPSAKIAADVSVGPWTVIGPNVDIGEGTCIESHVIIKKNAKIGRNNHIHSFASVADDPQDIHYKDQETWLVIGDNNVVREFCTISRGSSNDDLTTSIGNNNYLMAYSHIAHDCIIGNSVVFTNGATIAGHVRVDDYANLGGSVLIHQFCNIGTYSFVGGTSAVNQDVLPYVVMHGIPAYPISVNVIGLRRRGFSESAIEHIRHAYRIIFRRGHKLAEAILELEKMVAQCPEIQVMIDAINRSTRGLARPSIRSKQEREEETAP